MNTLQNRHDLTDEQWTKIEPLIQERLGKWGGQNANDNRVRLQTNRPSSED